MNPHNEFVRPHCSEGVAGMQASMWLELRIPAVHVTEEAFISMATSLDCLGIAEETEADKDRTVFTGWFASGDDVRQTRARITAACLLQGLPADAICLSGIGTEWETAWQRDWQAMPVGKNLWVRPSFCAPPTDNRIDIVLDPGMAFGTGQHATTQLCLEAIERICSEPMPASMLDMGAGSGLLAITAAKLGVKDMLAIDNDPTAVEACKVNAEINGVQIQSELGDTPPEGKFDLVVANILAGPLIDMAPKLAACVSKSLVLSGLLTTQVEDVSRAYVDAGMEVVRTDTKEEWAAVELKA